MTVRRWLIGGLFVLLSVSAAWFSPKGHAWLEHQYQRASFQWVADRVVASAPNPQEAVIRLMEYVHDAVHAPPQGKGIGDIEPLDILAAGRGWCDQQANVFVQLARTLPLDGRLVFLRAADSTSPHSVAEVYLDGAWRVVDPLVGVVFPTVDGHLASREMLATHPGLVIEHPQLRMLMAAGSTTDFAAMQAWYRQEPTVFNTWRGRKAWLDRLPLPLRSGTVCALQTLYWWHPGSRRGMSPVQYELARAQHAAVLERWALAERLYRKILRRRIAETSARDDACFFLGRLYLAQGRWAEARDTLEAALHEYPDTGWASHIHAGLGRAYEAMNQPELAFEAYQRSQLASAEYLIARRLLALQMRDNRQDDHL